MTEALHQATRIINQGGIILYPTDTIWGIGCDATNASAVQRIYQAKRRPDRKSMLVLMNEPSMLNDYLEHVPSEILEMIRSAERPTTIIYPGSRNFAHNLPAEDGSIGIRITSDPFCKQLIEMTGKPIVSTSANISGDPAPRSFAEITTGVRSEVDYVVEWRQQEERPSIPSAILKLNSDGSIIQLRP